MNTNKVISADKNGICIQYTDANKHQWINFEINSTDKQLSNKNYQDANNLNPKQIKLYRLVIYGVTALTEAELLKLSVQEKTDIESSQKKAQITINRFKQQVTSIKIDSLLEKIFFNSKLIKSIRSNDYICDDLKNTLTFKELNINQKNRIDALIRAKCLPDNFYQLK